MQRNAVSCVNQNLSLWIRLVGSGFVSSAQREHLYPEWFDSSVTDPGYQIIDDEIVANALGEGNSDDESKEEEVMGEHHSITPLEAFHALDTSLQWLESQGTEPQHLLLMKKWRDTAARMRLESLSQTEITTYFSRTD